MSAPQTPGRERADLQIEISLPPDADPVEVDAATTRLRRELLDLDVDHVGKPTAGAPPPGARSAELIALGGLVVTLARSAGAFAPVIRTLQSWLARDRNRTVRLELDGDTIEVTGVSSAEQDRLISAWIARHTEA